MSESQAFAIFAGQKYLSLETVRKKGDALRPPVWPAPQPPVGTPETLYFYTVGDTGKVKRIRNNPGVRIAPCDIRGNVKGAWVEARVEILSGGEAERGMKLLDRKYLPWKQFLGLFAMFSRRERVVMALHAA
jgi:PPOX class probable F420-dependent enzyme